MFIVEREKEVKSQMPDIRDQISRIIRDKAYKQATIAKRAGLSPVQLCATLKRRRRLDANEFILVCNAMGMPLDDVVAYRPNLERNTSHEGIQDSNRSAYPAKQIR